MISKQTKQTTVDELDKALAECGSVFLVDFAKITVGDDTLLRKNLRQQGIFYRVAKNTLIKRSLEKAGISELDKFLTQPTAILVGTKDDPIAPARVIVEFQKAHENLLNSKSTFMDGEVFPASAIEAVSKMPGKRELQAQIIQLFTSPASTLIGLIKGPGSQIASQVEALVKRLEENA